MTGQQIQEIMKDELLMEIIEEELPKYEITVDYYIQEFARELYIRRTEVS